MGRYFVSILNLSIAIILLLSNTEGFGYPTPVDFDGSLLRWNISIDDEPITYEIKSKNPTDSENFESVIEESATLWSSVPNSYFRYTRADSDTQAQVTINLERSIDGSAVSSGYAVFDKYSNQQPEHCSIFILIDESFSSNSIAKTILHELGHCLGLGHSLIPEAIMSYQLDKNSFGLDIDDQAAVSRLYPADGSSPKLPPGCSIGIGRMPFNLGLIVLFLPVLFTFGYAGRKPKMAFEKRPLGHL